MAKIQSTSMAVDLPEWAFYFCMIDDHPTSVAFNLAIQARVPVPNFEILTRITIPLLEKGSHGLTKSNEAKRLDEMQETFETIVNKPVSFFARMCAALPTEAIFVGRVTGAGRRDLYFYSNEEIDRRHFQELIRRFPEHPFEVRTVTDATWSSYLTNLHPAAALHPLLLSWIQLESRQKHGDQLNIPRDVNHTLSFKSEKGRKDFLNFIKDDGWKTRTFELDSASESLECRFGVELTKRHEIDRISIDIYIVALTSRAVQFLGKYDGWGAFEVKK